MAGIFSAFLALYGIGDSQAELKVSGASKSKKLCEDPSTRKSGDSKDECMQKLVRTDRDRGPGADQFLMKHIDLLQSTQRDIYASRIGLILTVLRSFPLWFLFILFALIIVGIIIGIIPFLVILGNLDVGGWTKVVVLMLVILLSIFGYMLIPI
jgi:hypothetical protein